MKICFWGGISNAILGRTPGGGELQIALLAKALALNGHEVVILDPTSKEDFISKDGIKVIRIKGWDNGIPVLRYLTHRISLLYRSLKEQNADIYYCRIQDFRHIIAYKAAKKVHGKFVLAMASNLDAMSFRARLKYRILNSPVNAWAVFNSLAIECVYPFLLKHADVVLVQHEGQKEILLKKKIQSRVFYNIIEETSEQQTDSIDDGSFIYVGSIDKRKGILDFFKLVNETPNVKYKVAGLPREKTGRIYYEKLRSFSNVELFGRLSHENTIREISKSRALISTSLMEGFPNIFLEAWSVGVPVISLNVNPGNIFKRGNLGIFCENDFKILKKSVLNFKKNKYSKEFMYSYIAEVHSFSGAATRFLDTIGKVKINKVKCVG